jgi:hypothetical protein
MSTRSSSTTGASEDWRESYEGVPEFSFPSRMVGAGVFAVV